MSRQEEGGETEVASGEVEAGEALIDVPPGLPGIEESGCLLRIDALLHALHPATAAEVKQVLALLENPVLGLIDFRVRPLSRLAPDARRAILARWQQSSIPSRRTAIRAVHGLLCANYWADKRTHAYMGYAGPPAWALELRMAGGADDG